MRSWRALFLAALVVILAVSSYAAFLYFADRSSRESVSSVTIAGYEIEVEIADTPEGRQRGLSGRSELKKGTGMLFVFEQPDLYAFWMKDMLFPIDIIWISEDMRVVHIEESVAPATYPATFVSQLPAKYVLELEEGAVKSLEIDLSDFVQI